MKQALGFISLVVRKYDEAITFCVGILGFTLVEDKSVPEQDKRWVVVAPAGSTESGLLLARASSPEQMERIGNQIKLLKNRGNRGALVGELMLLPMSSKCFCG